MKFITFYSYKGGAGRTVCTVNMIPLLAKQLGASKKTPMLVMDMDLDSAGLTHILEQHKKFEKSEWVSTNFITTGGSELYITNKNSRNILLNTDYYINDDINSRSRTINAIATVLQEWEISSATIRLLDDIEIRKSSLESFLKIIESSEISIDEKQRIITDLNADLDPNMLLTKIENFIPANGMVDISNFFNDFEEGSIRFIGLKQGMSDLILPGEALKKIRDLRRICENENFCAILIDSASGTQPIANALHRMNGSDIVYCMRLTKQFREGTKLRLLEIIKETDYTPLNIILLPVAVPEHTYEETPNLVGLKSLAYSQIGDISEMLKKEAVDGKSGISIHNDFVQTGIPEVESFKWEESILYKKEILSKDQEKALEKYKQLAEKIGNTGN